METDHDNIHLLIGYNKKVFILQIVRKIEQETIFELCEVLETYLKNYFWKERIFWFDRYFACSIGEVRVITQFKNILRIKDRAIHVLG